MPSISTLLLVPILFWWSALALGPYPLSPEERPVPTKPDLAASSPSWQEVPSAMSFRYDGVFASVNSVHGMALDKYGRMWLCGFGSSNAGIYVLDAKGNHAPFSPIETAQFGSTTIPTKTQCRGLAVDHDGHVVAVVNNYHLVRFDVDTGASLGILPFDASTARPAVSAAGGIYVARVVPPSGATSTEVHVVSTEDGLTTTGSFDLDPAVLTRGITADDPYLYLTQESSTSTLRRFARTAAGTYALDNEATIFNGSNTSVSIAPDGTVWATDEGDFPDDPEFATPAIRVLDYTTHTYWTPTLDSLMLRPRAVTFTPNMDTMYVAAYQSGVVQRFIATSGKPTIPGKVALLSPADGASSVASTPTLSWQLVGGAESYDVQVATTPYFGDPVFNGQINQASTQVEGLAWQTTYYWRVRATTGGARGAWTTTRSFTIRSKPPPTIKEIKAIPSFNLDQLDSAGEHLTEEDFQRLTRSAYEGQEVTFTAVVLTNPLNSGVASTASRIHVFVRDTSAVHDADGMLGYAAQIVDGSYRDNGWLSIGKGYVVEINAQVSYFNESLQLTPTSVTVLATDYSQLGLPDTIMQPVDVELSDLNKQVPYTDPDSNIEPQVTVNISNYPLLNEDYVRITQATVLARTTAPEGRPQWVVTNGEGNAHVQIYDLSLRYRNDRSGNTNYVSAGFNVREDAFTPPPVGATVHLQGFAFPNFYDAFGIATPDDIHLTLVPFEDEDLTVLPFLGVEDDFAVTGQGKPVAIPVLRNDNETFSLDGVGRAANGSVAIEGDLIRYTPDAGFAGVDTFTYQAGAGGEVWQGNVNVSVSTSSAARIITDERFDDWADVPTLYADPLDQPSQETDVRSVAVANDERYLFLRLTTEEPVDLVGDPALVLHVDADGDPSTGTVFPGMGAELSYTFSDGTVRLDGEAYGSDAIGLVALPSFASTSHEIMLDVQALHGGLPIFSSDTLRFVLTTGLGERVPDAPAPLAYTLADAGALEPLLPIPLMRSADALRLASLNVERDGIFGGERKAAFGRMLRAVSPAVLGLQEVYTHTAEDVVALATAQAPLPDGESWHAVKEGGDLVLLSRFPIIETFNVGQSSAVLLDTRSVLGTPLLAINAHFPCCEFASARQNEADAIMAFLRGVKTGDHLQVPLNTPFVILGTLNTVGAGRSLSTLLEGTISDTGAFGPAFSPDWDDSPLSDALPRSLHAPTSFTWRGSREHPPGRHDFVLYTDSQLRVQRAFALSTSNLPPDSLSAYGLQDSDAATVSDHFLIAGDFVPVFPLNRAPHVVDDAFTMAEDGSLVVTPLDNDADLDGDPLTVSAIGAPRYGTVTLGGNGEVVYAPDPDYFGRDAFSYTASDGAMQSTGTVSITVLPVNDAPSFNASDPPSVLEDAGPQALAHWAEFVPGPPNEDAQTVVSYQVEVLTNPQFFTTAPAIDPDGTLRFEAAPDSNGTATFSVQVTDDGGTSDGGQDESATLTFQLPIEPVNDAPIAVFQSDLVEGLAPLSVSFDASGSFDIEGDPLQYTWDFGDGAVGTGRIITHTYVEGGSFAPTLRVSDGQGGDAEASAQVRVVMPNRAPIALADTFRTNEDQRLRVFAPGLLINDTDLDGDTLVVTIVDPPAQGNIALSSDGSFIYIPSQDIYGTDHFAYAAHDGEAADTAQVVIDVLPMNDPPRFDAPYFSAPEDGAVLHVGGLENMVEPDDSITIRWKPAQDADGDSLSYTWEIAAEESFGAPLLTIEAGREPQVELSHGDLSAAIKAQGVALGEERAFWHRILAADDSALVTSPGVSLPVIRGRIVSTDEEGAPGSLSLSPVRPNPFRRVARATFALTEAGRVRVTLHDMLGRQVAVLADAAYAPGKHDLVLEGSSIPSGTYVLRLEAMGRVLHSKAVLLR